MHTLRNNCVQNVHTFVHTVPSHLHTFN